MKLAAVVVTRKGFELARQLADDFPGLDILAAGSFTEDFPESVQPLPGSLSEMAGEMMDEYDGLIFIMALGIVVRVIAPWLEDKREDPAVVTVDEAGSWVISTLSGHLGGANELAEKTADILQTEAIITTATDVRSRPALDLLAEEIGGELVPFENLKRAGSHMLAGGKLEIICAESYYKNIIEESSALNSTDREFCKNKIEFSCFGSSGSSPAEAVAAADGFPLLVSARDHDHNRFELLLGNEYIQLIPREIVIGVGARKGIESQAVIGAVMDDLKELGFHSKSLKALATADIKQEEPGIKKAAARLDVPLEIVSREEIAAEMKAPSLSDQNYSFSKFVKDKIGVGGVCEPAAVLQAKPGKLIRSKKNHGDLTTAVARTNFM
ncbi:cobalt-precorrin 5A hydrolase [Halarsenatibacter silvermanii]|uniref:Cobalt-precorrin 5A acetaldehyde-lyase n=1 Tax=Halarsenatibacter silvermanii TaxID=321763 RepID=A0A1G9Q2A2_9FIRM|nr:cobalamin biosynthesis protein [Halarsenatibacter silvermanii]SDM05154.1 cobalt-precorrin 5A acetaldehyde-lyase [Halarsenatibacter silvermanii]